jgi:hypothetical protein
MLTPSDLLPLPYTPDLNEAGITYACRALAHGRVRLDRSIHPRLKRLAGEIAVELALRRNLREQGLRFSAEAAAPLSDPDRYDLRLEGRRCRVVTYVISHPQQAAALGRDPALLLQASALLPLDEAAGETRRPDDLYVFAFLLAEAEPRPQAQAYRIQPLGREWARPSLWQPLVNLTLTNEAETTQSFHLVGLDREREVQTCPLRLAGKESQSIEIGLHSLAYIQADELPGSSLRLACPPRSLQARLPVQGWCNLWMGAAQIIVAGWMGHEEFRHRGALLLAGAHTFQFDQTRVKNLQVPLSDLHPLKELFERLPRLKNGSRLASP